LTCHRKENGKLAIADVIDIAPVNKFSSLMRLLWALRKFWRFTLH